MGSIDVSGKASERSLTSGMVDWSVTRWGGGGCGGGGSRLRLTQKQLLIARAAREGPQALKVAPRESRSYVKVDSLPARACNLPKCPEVGSGEW